ncbi:MAG: glycosyltransferase family 9 protein, partial [Acidobacteria bacterium]|nr:glycosyltransferase family 9 protein [Acidobacteriota bacterium]
MIAERPQRILIVRLGSLGDILHALPMLVTLKENFPHWEVDWLLERRWKPLLEANPYLSRL